MKGLAQAGLIENVGQVIADALRLHETLQCLRAICRRNACVAIGIYVYTAVTTLAAEAHFALQDHNTRIVVHPEIKAGAANADG